MSKQGWKQIADVKGFINAKGNIRTGTHNLVTKKRLIWPYCTNCGLMFLKNEVTRKAMKAPCVWEDD